MTGPLDGRTALVTGASRGLGRACAVELAAAGAYVVCTGRSVAGNTTQPKIPGLTLDETVARIRAVGDGEFRHCDHTSPDQVDRLLRGVVTDRGGIDILVNNAWGGHDAHDETAVGEEVWDEPLDQFRAMLLAGAYSDFVTSMLTLKHAMGPARHGIILTTTWHTPEPPAWPPYESSKAAKNRLVYALGYHLQGKGIPVIAVAPGWMRTELMVASQSPETLAGRTESPTYAARVVAALAGDPDAMRFSGQVVDVGAMAEHYDIDDIDGSRPQSNAGRYEPARSLPPLRS